MSSPDRDHHRPALFGGRQFEAIAGADDPAAVMRAAHESARTLLARTRGAEDPAVLERLVRYTDEHGIDVLAELWARAAPASLPGALWRIHLLQAAIRQDPDGVSLLFQRGTEVLATADAAVAGAPSPAGPDEVVALADALLRGAFSGDLGLALDRAAAFSRLVASGAADVADDQEAASPERATLLTTRALRFSAIADELARCARLARDEALD